MNKKGELTHIGGESLIRFVLHSALLRLIDPVRGEPTRSTLDENPDPSLLGAWQLKQKFLDSFALLGSTSSSGAETATAVCLETHGRVGNILRMARNHGLTTRDLAGLEKVLQVLRDVASKEKSSIQAEPEILRLVVELDRGRIFSIAERIEKRGIRNVLRKTKSGFVQSEKFRLWLEKCPFTACPSPLRDWSHATTTILIHWASEARWYYAEELQTLVGLDQLENQAWLNNLHKLARYHSAIKSMVKFAVKEPGIFVKIFIKEITAPHPRPFKFPRDKAPLLAVIRTLVGEDANTTIEQLEKHLGTKDVEARLRRACRLDLTLHAEMQMVVFYEGNPGFAPSMQLIGTSKKACFLCDRYLRQHPLRLQASACHQKIYPSWMPPPYYKVPGKFMNIPFVRLSDDIEKLTREELKAALTAPLRPPNYDSTAGPSLTLTATVPTELRSLRETREKSTVRDNSFSEDSD
ncbi:hypothetical protein F53441_12778 [Fusarium austroafricanum]|uniref:Uncharacterized protein n=1 Tax=Fusarium austroafricanum TaxID=2364996 RepID=A0A8H4JVK1_9HYPO|nr:hypothetical protein F53441_12778 [Fusarium austroafricanum]